MCVCVNKKVSVLKVSVLFDSLLYSTCLFQMVMTLLSSITHTLFSHSVLL